MKEHFKFGDLLFIVEPTEVPSAYKKVTKITIGKTELPEVSNVPVSDVAKVLASYGDKAVKIIHV